MVYKWSVLFYRAKYYSKYTIEMVQSYKNNRPKHHFLLEGIESREIFRLESLMNLSRLLLEDYSSERKGALGVQYYLKEALLAIKWLKLSTLKYIHLLIFIIFDTCSIYNNCWISLIYQGSFWVQSGYINWIGCRGIWAHRSQSQNIVIFGW